MPISAAEILEILDELGITASVEEYAASAFDPDTNTTALGVKTPHSIKVVPPYKNVEGFKPAEFITSGKGLTGFANSGVTFSVVAGLRIVIDSVLWIVTGVTPVRTNAGIVYYQLEVETT